MCKQVYNGQENIECLVNVDSWLVLITKNYLSTWNERPYIYNLWKSMLGRWCRTDLSGTGLVQALLERCLVLSYCRHSYLPWRNECYCRLERHRLNAPPYTITYVRLGILSVVWEHCLSSGNLIQYISSLCIIIFVSDLHIIHQWSAIHNRG